MLRRRLTFPAAGIALVLSFVLTGLGIWAGNVIVSIMSNQLIEQMTEGVRREVDDMITFGDRMSTRMVNDLARHDIPFSDPVALRRELFGLVSDEPDVRWLACGNEAGGMTDAGRVADGTLVFLMTDDFRAGVYREYQASPDGRLGNLRKSGVYFDTRETPWYTRVSDTRARYWAAPFLGSVERLLGVALSAPVFNTDGSFAGVCNVRLIFTALSDWMNSLRLGDTGRAFIIDATGNLIAASGGVSPVAIDADGKQLRLHASEAADPIVRETARHLGRHPEIAGASSTGPQVFSVDDPERGRIYAAVDRFEAPGEIKWTIISAVPASDFLGPVYRAAYLSIVIGAVLVAVFVVLGLWVVGRTLRPLTALTQAAQAIAKGEWGDVPEVRRNDEVGLLAQAFTLMTARLKETLEGLRRSEAKLEEAQRVAHVGYWERDLDTDRITWSDETYRVFGLTPGEGTITLAGMRERIHPEDRPIWSQAAADGLGGASRCDLEYRVVRPNGELRIVHSQGDLTRDASGRPRSLFGTIQDITERKRAEEALREVQMELTHANRVTTIGQLTASVAHEVSQPIAAAVTNAQAALRWLVAQPPDLEEVRQALGRIIKNGGRAGDVIGRIRALIKKAPPRKDRFDLNEAILDVISLTRSEVLKHGVSLQTQLLTGLPAVDGDRIQLQQVILNLILNAVEAMSDIDEGARELRISTETDAAGGVLVAVRDTGPGLDPTSVDRLFEAFYTTKPGGMGMGLSICRSIIEAHGGRLWACANEPWGAVFQFTLPPQVVETVPAEHAGPMPVV
ncbi:MAG TPA: ATP-binding protein [Stellaceae bacterium]|nr:ATP-binding protein [Stellaceae bacterium]